MTEQAEPSESKESKTPGALTRWPEISQTCGPAGHRSAQLAGRFETSRSRNSSMATIW